MDLFCLMTKGEFSKNFCLTSHNQKSYIKDTTINATSHTTKPMPKPEAMPAAICRLCLIAKIINDINAIKSRPRLICRQISTLLSPSVFKSSGFRRVKTTEAIAKRVGGIAVATVAIQKDLSLLQPSNRYSISRSLLMS
jgi:hypothetical protein